MIDLEKYKIQLTLNHNNVPLSTCPGLLINSYALCIFVFLFIFNPKIGNTLKPNSEFVHSMLFRSFTIPS